jgi:hypothetical protein
MFPDVAILLGSPLNEVFQLWIEELLPLLAPVGASGLKQLLQIQNHSRKYWSTRRGMRPEQIGRRGRPYL